MKKMITQLLLSLSIFSFVFSCYSLCSSSQSHPPNLPANPFMNLHYSSHAVNKSYVFLICNALLVFLSKTSGLLCSSSGFDLNDMLQKRVGDGMLLQTYNNETKEPSFLQWPPQEEDEEGERILNEETKDQISLESDEDYLRGICDDDHDFEADADKIHEEDTENCSLAVDGMIEEEEEEEDKSMDQQEVAEEDALSTEELNKKFEEFIRKTKEEIMMNEARQLIIVK